MQYSTNMGAFQLTFKKCGWMSEENHREESSEWIWKQKEGDYMSVSVGGFGRELFSPLFCSIRVRFFDPSQTRTSKKSLSQSSRRRRSTSEMAKPEVSSRRRQKLEYLIPMPQNTQQKCRCHSPIDERRPTPVDHNATDGSPNNHPTTTPSRQRLSSS
jgi:hypothetical protein